MTDYITTKKLRARLLPALALGLCLLSACRDKEGSQLVELGDGDGTLGSGGSAFSPEQLARLGPDGDGPIVIPRSTGSGDGSSRASGGSESGAPSSGFLSLCETSAGYSVSLLEGSSIFDDFEDGNDWIASNGRVGQWYTYGDGTGQFLPGDNIELTEPGFGDSDYALRVGGVGFNDWGSGAGIGLASTDTDPCLHDLSVYSGISFRARGRVGLIDEDQLIDQDEGQVRLLLLEKDVTPVEQGGNCDASAGGCWDSHRVRFALDECWRLFTFDFDEFEQDGWGYDGGELNLDELHNLSFEIAAHNDWELWVDDIRFYAGEAPQGEVDCSENELGWGGNRGN